MTSATGRAGMENALTHVVNALPGLLWTARPDGQIDFLNRRWCDYTGLQADRGLGVGWQSVVHAADLPELIERWQAIRVSGEPGEIEARLRRFDGEYRWFLCRISPLSEASGSPVKWCGLHIDIEDKRRDEDMLRASERRSHMIIDGLPTLVAISSATFQLESANLHYLEYFGGTMDELKALGPVHNCHPHDRPGIMAARQLALETGRPYEIEARRRRADGAYRWFHLRHFPLKDTHGRIVLWCLLQTDIEDRKRAEALLAGERSLLEMVAAGESMSRILEALCQLVEETVSGCFCSVVLVDSSGTRLAHGAAPSLPASFIDSIVGLPVNLTSGPCAMAVCRNEQVVVADLASETRWAAYEWCPLALAQGLQACWSTPISSAAGKVLGEFAIYYTEPRTPTPEHQAMISQIKHIASIAIARAQNDAALKRSETFLAETRRISSIGGFSKRGATDEITWSKEIYRMYEFDPAVPVTLDLIYSRIHPEDLPSVLELIELQRSGCDYEHEYRLLMPDSSIKYLHVIGHASVDHAGQLEYITTIQDITERRRSEEALAKARSELAHMARVTSLGALTASIAHEVNQPLSGIITNASTCLRMLAADPPNIDGARETARRTIRDGNRASDVIMRLRALFTKKTVVTESIDLNEATREVIALSRSELQRNRVIVQTELADNLPCVVGDRVQLQQVILNLLLNASDAMSGIDDHPRQLVISTELYEGDQVRLGVKDSGVGFDSHDVNRLFEAFYTTKSAGMGIGLSVSLSIIESHQGHIWATPNEGRGATFFFSIPQRGEGDTLGSSSVAGRATDLADDQQPTGKAQ